MQAGFKTVGMAQTTGFVNSVTKPVGSTTGTEFVHVVGKVKHFYIPPSNGEAAFPVWCPHMQDVQCYFETATVWANWCSVAQETGNMSSWYSQLTVTVAAHHLTLNKIPTCHNVRKLHGINPLRL
jgi:hypothetical protein